MMRIALLFAALTAVVGCSTTQIEARGQMFQLQERQVITRDLTRPVGLDNEPKPYHFDAFPQTIRRP